MRYKYSMNKETYSSHDENLIPFLAALCIFLSAVEYVIPKPLPFMRLGLANLPIILSLFLLPSKQYFFLVLVKILGQAILSGTLFSYIFLFSAGGTFASGFAMFIVYRILNRYVSCAGLSLFGSLANNSVQFLLARFILFGEGAFYIAPLLFISGAVTGLLLGFTALYFSKSSRWFYLCKNKELPLPSDLPSQNEANSGPSAIGGKKRKVKILPSLLIFVSIVFFSLLQPQGKVLFSIFSFDITSAALLSGVQKAFLLTLMVVISRIFITSSFRLPGKAGLFMNRVFQYLALLTGKRIEKGNWKSVFKAIDNRLLSVYFA